MHIVIISLDNVWMLQRINKRNSYRVTSLPAQCRSTKQSRRKLRGDTFRRRNIHDSVAARASYPQHTRPPKRVTWVETFNGQTQSSLVIVIWLSGYTGSPIHSHVDVLLGKIPVCTGRDFFFPGTHSSKLDTDGEMDPRIEISPCTGQPSVHSMTAVLELILYWATGSHIHDPCSLRSNWPGLQWSWIDDHKLDAFTSKSMLISQELFANYVIRQFGAFAARVKWFKLKCYCTSQLSSFYLLQTEKIRGRATWSLKLTVRNSPAHFSRHSLDPNEEKKLQYWLRC